jgi:hypothetical protein
MKNGITYRFSSFFPWFPLVFFSCLQPSYYVRLVLSSGGNSLEVLCLLDRPILW